jgi:uncharacterized protein YegL
MAHQVIVMFLVLVAASHALSLDVSRRKLEELEHELQKRMIEREMERDNADLRRDADMYKELEEVELSVRGIEKRQAIEGCIQGDVIFVLDSSGSIGETNWIYVLQFVKDIVDRMGVGEQQTHVGLITYGNRAHIIFQLNNYTDSASMKAAIDGTKFLDENTNTSGGIYTAHKIMFTPENGDRPLAPNMMVIITDGVSTYDNDKTIPYANEAKQAGIMVISLGVGNKTSQEELEGMASVGKDGQPLVYQVGGYDMLNLVKEKLAHVTCAVEEKEDVLCEPTEVPCPGMSCKNKCKFGFAPDINLCLTCNCLPENPNCP